MENIISTFSGQLNALPVVLGLRVKGGASKRDLSVSYIKYYSQGFHTEMSLFGRSLLIIDCTHTTYLRFTNNVKVLVI